MSHFIVAPRRKSTYRTRPPTTSMIIPFQRAATGLLVMPSTQAFSFPRSVNNAPDRKPPKQKYRRQITIDQEGMGKRPASSLRGSIGMLDLRLLIAPGLATCRGRPERIHGRQHQQSDKHGLIPQALIQNTTGILPGNAVSPDEDDKSRRFAQRVDAFPGVQSTLIYCD